MINLWHSLCERKIGFPIEIMIGNRREHPHFKSFVGELHAAYPMIVDGKVVLALWLDSLSNVTSIIVTHEIGHWVLKLQGFCGMIYKPKIHCDIEIALNTMAHHSPLYALQRSLGHEPQRMIDSRTDHNIKIFSKERDIGKRSFWVRNALYVADDCINCSSEKCVQLREILRRRHPNTAKNLRKILSITSHFNLLNPKQNIRFSRKIILKLKLGDRWSVVHELEELKKMDKKVSK